MNHISPNASYWESQSFLRSDVLIVGGGIVGLSTAAELLERKPNLKVTVLERGVLPSGASTRNAGFACFGSLSEVVSDIAQFGESVAMETLQARVTGLQRLRQRLPDHAMDYQQHGGYELLQEPQWHLLDQLDRINALLKPVFAQEVFQRADHRLNEFGFSARHVSGLLLNPLEGQLHTGMLMRSLLQYVQKLGALVLSGTEVTAIETINDGVIVHGKSGSDLPTMQFSCGQLALCTNAFARRLMPELSITPGRGQVLITEPIPALRWQGTFHADEGYYYFRNIDQRILLGGARNADFDGECTDQFGENARVGAALEQFLREIIAPELDLQIAQRWSGIMAFGETKKPIVTRHDHRTVIGVRMGGMGVAIGSSVAASLADMLLDD